MQRQKGVEHYISMWISALIDNRSWLAMFPAFALQQYIRECSAAGFDRQQAMEGGIILTENESIIPASQIQGKL